MAQTSSGAGHALSEDDEIKLLQRLIKQRKDSAAIYKDQNRDDLAAPEEEQAKVIAKFLPEQLSLHEIEKIVSSIILKISAEGMKDMGKVMGMATMEMAGKADGKTISDVVKSKLSI